MERRFKIGDNVRHRNGVAVVVAVHSSTAAGGSREWSYHLHSRNGADLGRFASGSIKAIHNRANGSVTRLRLQVEEQAKEIESLRIELDEMVRALKVEAGRSLSSELEANLGQANDALRRTRDELEHAKMSASEMFVQYERECKSAAKLRDLLADSQASEKRARRTVELMRAVLNMVES